MLWAGVWIRQRTSPAQQRPVLQLPCPAQLPEPAACSMPPQVPIRTASQAPSSQAPVLGKPLSTPCIWSHSLLSPTLHKFSWAGMQNYAVLRAAVVCKRSFSLPE